ncbi:MAG: hypothetical protein V4773_19485 [Verrucomicrobiota bacterium]
MDSTRGYEHKSSTDAKITVTFISGSDKLSRDQLDAPDFPGARAVSFPATVQSGQRFSSLQSLARISDEQYIATAATVNIHPRFVGSIQVIRFSAETGRREVVSYRSHGFYLGGFVFTDGDYVVAREVTGY